MSQELSKKEDLKTQRLKYWDKYNKSEETTLKVSDRWKMETHSTAPLLLPWKVSRLRWWRYWRAQNAGSFSLFAEIYCQCRWLSKEIVFVILKFALSNGIVFPVFAVFAWKMNKGLYFQSILRISKERHSITFYSLDLEQVLYYLLTF